MKARWTTWCWSFLVLLWGLGPRAIAAPPAPAASAAPAFAAGPAVALRAASGAAIPFHTQNGRAVSGVPPQTVEIPHLVLTRNGTLSDPDERTLVLEFSGIDVPSAGVTVTLQVATQHEDPDSGDDDGHRIPVWREARRLANTSGLTETNVGVAFVHEFTDTLSSGSMAVRTPTDYFRFEVTVTDAGPSTTHPMYQFSADYALLMESQWNAPLPAVSEGTPGAAPGELVVYYCDMFPFRKSSDRPATWLPREKVTAYVGMELVPHMVDAFRLQSDEWGFPWYEEWTSYRSEDPERLSVALTDTQTWFHGAAPSGGHSGISINVHSGNNASFASLADGILSTFHHELFHQLQRNISLHGRGDGRVGGMDDAWQLFSEGTAVLAQSVGQPRGQLVQAYPPTTYMSHANGFMWRSRTQGMNLSYDDMDPYQAAIYWRFLYEQCGGMANGGGPSAAMQVTQRALTVLYAGDVVDIRSSTDLVGAIPTVLDQALAGSSCPFQTYAESLTAFARALFALRLEDGRCIAPDTPAGCGFYDPSDQYEEPPFRTIAYDGTEQAYHDGIRSSFGIDLIEMDLGPASAGLTLEVYGAPVSAAQFDVQVLCLANSGESGKPRRILAEIAAADVPAMANSNGRLLYAVPVTRTATCNKLGLIVTRLDAQETLDPIGAYTIVLRAAVSRTGAA